MVAIGVSAEARAEGQASVYFGRSGLDILPLGYFSTYGGSVGLFSGPVGAEVAVEYSPLGGIDLGPIGIGASLTNLMGNFVVQVPMGRVQPYGTVGYGALIGSAGIDPFFRTSGTAGAINFGGGAKIYFTERVGARLDFRRFVVQTGDVFPEIPIPFTDFRLSLDPNINRFSGGVSFRF
jgi:hypothetical protein